MQYFGRSILGHCQAGMLLTVDVQDVWTSPAGAAMPLPATAEPPLAATVAAPPPRSVATSVRLRVPTLSACCPRCWHRRLGCEQHDMPATGAPRHYMRYKREERIIAQHQT